MSTTASDDLRHFKPAPRQEWFKDATCKDSDPNLFFVQDVVSVDKAKTVCRSCPIQVQCLEYALEFIDGGSTSTTFGVWGGESARGRMRIKRARRGEVNHVA